MLTGLAGSSSPADAGTRLAPSLQCSPPGDHHPQATRTTPTHKKRPILDATEHSPLLTVPLLHSPDDLPQSSPLPFLSPFASPVSSSSPGSAGIVTSADRVGHKGHPAKPTAPRRALARTPTDSPSTTMANKERPTVKRRKTAPELTGSPKKAPIIEIASAVTAADKKSSNSNNNGPDVWFGAVEDAFNEALRVIPRLGRRKVLLDGKPCGRNELISDYIQAKTGETRTRKQVSSHIQVFKILHRDNPEMLALVHEPRGDEEEGNELPIAMPPYTASDFAASLPMRVSRSDGLLSPYGPSSMGMYRSASVASSASSRSVSPMPSPLHSPAMPPSPMLEAHAPTSAATSSLTDAMRVMSLPDQQQQYQMMQKTSCLVGLSHFAMWTGDRAKKHVFTRMNRKALMKGMTTKRMDELVDFDMRYPGLVTMHQHLRCQFMHATVDLDIPSEHLDNRLRQIQTKLQLTSLHNLDLAVVTTIYSFGTVVLSLQEDLGAPSVLSIDGTDAEGAPVRTASNPFGHFYSYRVPFAADFWTIFFGGSSANSMPDVPSFAKAGVERNEFAMAVSGLSVVQEFVVKPDPIRAPHGSPHGESILVVTYDLNCRDPSESNGGTSTNLSILLAPAPLVPSPSLQPPLAQPAIVKPSRPGHKSTGSIGKPNLSLQIPPKPTFYPSSAWSSSAASSPSLRLQPPFSAGGGSAAAARLADGGIGIGITQHDRALNPITPLPQMLHTPRSPPPLPVDPSPAQTNRLHKLWAQTSSEWGLDSPALLGAFPQMHPHPHSHPQSQSQAQQAGQTKMGPVLQPAVPVAMMGPPRKKEEDYFNSILGASTRYSAYKAT